MRVTVQLRSGAQKRLKESLFLSMYWVYILYSKKLNRFYTGTTDDVLARLSEHNY
jgi:predicted GIY-YIG superfamily endonuclease